MAEGNLYILLEIKSTASSNEIKSAYRALAKKYHPDKKKRAKTLRMKKIKAPVQSD